MTDKPLRFVFLGLSITSSWGNGHATTYRGLLRELQARGHDMLFLERDVPWYALNRDLPEPPFCRIELYRSVADLQQRFTEEIRSADVVIVGSYVPEGAAVGEWVTRTAHGLTAFYDIDTPVTMAALAAGECEYLTPRLIARYQLYLSFTGGPVLERLQHEFGAPAAHALYCSFDPQLYAPLANAAPVWDLGYMGTYSEDRQPALERLLLSTAHRWPGGRFVVAGPKYPATVRWPANVARTDHLSPTEHRSFYCSQRFTLNITRSAMIATGWSPSVRLFEAAACGTPIISDYWEGLESIFTIDREILVARSWRDVVPYLIDMPEAQRRRIGARAKRRVLRAHTAAHRAAELEAHVQRALSVVSAA
jgi:spore maturation protein CgeB